MTRLLCWHGRPAETSSSRLWLKQMTTERLTVEIGIEIARLSPWLSNQSMCLWPAPLDGVGNCSRGRSPARRAADSFWRTDHPETQAYL